MGRRFLTDREIYQEFRYDQAAVRYHRQTDGMPCVGLIRLTTGEQPGVRYLVMFDDADPPETQRMAIPLTADQLRSFGHDLVALAAEMDAEGGEDADA